MTIHSFANVIWLNGQQKSTYSLSCHFISNSVEMGGVIGRTAVAVSPIVTAPEAVGVGRIVVNETSLAEFQDAIDTAIANMEEINKILSRTGFNASAGVDL